MDRSLKECSTKCQQYDGLPLAFTNFSQIRNELLYQSAKRNLTYSRTDSRNLNFGLPSYYVDVKYNFDDLLWYSRTAKLIYAANAYRL